MRAVRLVPVLALLWCLLPAPPAAAQGLPEDPILRIETGMHAARLFRLDTDAAGRLLISASDDGTARLWDADTGELLRILRLPLGTGRDGQVHAAALSPDGRSAAVAGWTRYGTDSFSVFVFDARSGRILRRIPGFGNVIHDLAFSADGRFLAVGGGGTSGVTVLETAGWTGAAAPGGYGDTVFGLDWDAGGQLATVSYDGHLRIYGDDLQVLRSVDLGNEALPFSVAFAPDGQHLAIGFASATPVELRDAATLGLLHRMPADQSDVSRGRGVVAWSADGQSLMAGEFNRWSLDVDRPITLRLWPDAGRGSAVDWPIGHHTLMGVLALRGGDVVVGQWSGALSRLSPDGAPRWSHELAMQNWLSSHEKLRLAPDGRGVGMTAWNALPLTFDRVARRLTDAEAPDDWLRARAEAGPMRLTQWQDSLAPLLNGQPLDVLLPHERALSVAVAPTGGFAALGASWTLYGLNPDGALRWHVPAPSGAFAVNLAQDGRSVVAALGDGTIRWYRAEDGAELLALFVHADRTRWVAWTPSGYYDGSPGGEDLIGWHVNRGLDQAPDFFPAYIFRDRYYRPDVVAGILDTLDEAEALAQGDARSGRTGPAPAPLAEVLPPVIRIRAPERDSPVAGDAVTVDLDVSTPPDAPLTEVTARVNGRLVPEARRDGERVTVPLPPLDDPELHVTLQPANRHGPGEAVDLRLSRAAPEIAPVELRPKLYVLSVGVSDYRDPDLRLGYAAKDAEDIAAFFAGQAGGLYREVEVRLLTDADATREAIEAGLFWLEEEVTAIDTAKIFIAGHGVNDNRGTLHFLPHEADLATVRSTGFSANRIVDTLEYLQGRVIYFMDTCHSGNLEFVRRGAAVLDLNRHLQDLQAATGAVVFSSASGSQFALESPEWGNGAFTLAVLEGLRGAADFNGDGSVSVNELNLFVSDMVKRLTGNQQTPVLQKPSAIRDFPLALLD